ncbi:DUF1987 domain-containing protein [Enterovirga aerilata]|uniref:DUF1987 domain-containing protein n=1 Tax=Enterovirga aerilata TaxID=2730920 RepID=A0A849IJE3_9HYPH|nr:DUF1987 domain-containing protein [Enterovirga sp. DB1703]NNM74063.1 DUF1987 domain-containing protein [Enterovirga sp. DB1703]
MDRISIAGTERTPEVDFDFPQGRLKLGGESYPEDAAAFFGPLQQALAAFLENRERGPLTFEIALTYFNSSSAKALMNMFMLLDDAAAGGAAVTVRWLHAADDDTIQEAGEDFAADFEHARFELVEQP